MDIPEPELFTDKNGVSVLGYRNTDGSVIGRFLGKKTVYTENDIEDAKNSYPYKK